MRGDRRPEPHFGAVNPPVYHVSTVTDPTIGALRDGEKRPCDDSWAEWGQDPDTPVATGP